MSAPLRPLGACLVAGTIYAGSEYIADVHDAHWDFASTKALEDAGLNIGTMLISGYGGKMLASALSSTVPITARGVLGISMKDFTSLPYLDTKIGERAIIKFDYISTAHLLTNNAVWSVAQCFTSLSSPCD